MELDIDMQRIRLRSASAIALAMVFLLLGVVLMSSDIDKCSWDLSRPSKPVSVSDLAQQTVFGTNDLDRALADRGFTICDPHDLRGWFSDEVIEPALIRSCLSNSENALFNIEFEDDGNDVRSHMKESLRQKGWSVMEEGDVLTCVKSKGSCRWMMIEYQDGEEGLSAVLRILRS